MDRRARPLAAFRLAAALSAAAIATAPAAATERRGTYRLHGKARLHTGSLLDRDLVVHADAVLRPGARPREVVARIAAEGGACDLLGSVDDAGAIAFLPGQRCVVDLATPDVRGRLDVGVRSGRGRLGDERLQVALSLAVAGTVAVRSASGSLLGAGERWTEFPIEGDVDAAAEGRRDRSRAAEP